MKNFYRGFIEVDDNKINEILRRLEDAKEEIYKCYSELEEAGLIVFRKTPAIDEGRDQS